MKVIICLSILLLSGTANNTYAANCTGDAAAVQQNAQTELSGQRITAIAPGGEEWNEDHCANGNLYKVGTTEGPPKHPERDSVDPRTPIGSWSPVGNDISYDYGTGGTYTFELWRDSSSTYYFCDGSSIVATIIAGPSTIPDSCL